MEKEKVRCFVHIGNPCIICEVNEIVRFRKFSSGYADDTMVKTTCSCGQPMEVSKGTLDELKERGKKPLCDFCLMPKSLGIS